MAKTLFREYKKKFPRLNVNKAFPFTHYHKVLSVTLSNCSFEMKKQTLHNFQIQHASDPKNVKEYIGRNVKNMKSKVNSH